MSDKGFQQCHDAARFGKASNTEMMIGQNYIGLRCEDGEDDKDGDEDKDLEDPRNCMSRLVCVRSAHLPPWCQPSSTILRQITQFKGYSCHHHHQHKLTCYHTTPFFTKQLNLR